MQLFIIFNDSNLPSIIPSSSSSPSRRLLHCSGNAARISCPLFLFIRRFSRLDLRAQLLIRRRHIGHVKLASSTFCLKHGIHNSWLHGMVTGSIKILIHIGHRHSDSRREGEFVPKLGPAVDRFPPEFDAIFIFLANCAVDLWTWLRLCKGHWHLNIYII